MRPDPSAWAKKYFTAASVSSFVFPAVIRGMIDKRFSSMAAHITMMFLEEIIISVLIKINEENMAEKGM